MVDPIRLDATVVAARSARAGGQADDGEAYWWQDVGSAVLGTTGWDLVLDLPSEAGQVHRVEIRTKQPNRLFGVRGFLGGELSIAPGAVLPVLVDPADPAEVEVDWKALAAPPGAREQLQAASDEKRSAQATAIAAEAVRKKPKQFERSRKVVLDGAQGLVDEILAGRQTASTLEQYLATNIPLGLITSDEAAAFRIAAGLPSA